MPRITATQRDRPANRLICGRRSWIPELAESAAYVWLEIALGLDFAGIDLQGHARRRGLLFRSESVPRLQLLRRECRSANFGRSRAIPDGGEKFRLTDNRPDSVHETSRTFWRSARCSEGAPFCAELVNPATLLSVYTGPAEAVYFLPSRHLLPKAMRLLGASKRRVYYAPGTQSTPECPLRT